MGKSRPPKGWEEQDDPLADFMPALKEPLPPVKDRTPEQLKASGKASGVTSVGTPGRNRKALATREVFANVMEKYGCPIEELASIGFNKENPLDIRLNALKEFASYGHSKLKTVEHTGADGAPLEMKMTLVNNILNLIKEKDVTNGG